MTTEREVLLLRHAKSNRDDPGDDKERGLAPRGEKAAPRMGRFIAEAGLIPDRVLVSTAARARATLDLVVGAWGKDAPQVEALDELYLAEPETILRLIQGQPDRIGRVMLVGHNPGFERTAMQLIGGGDAGAVEAMRSKFPTAALAQIGFRADSWADVKPGRGKLTRFQTPRNLDAD